MLSKTWIALGVLCVFVVALYAILRILSIDTKSLDDSHLRREIPDIPPEKNAFTYLERLPEVKNSTWISNLLWGRIEWDQEVVDQVIEANTEGLALVRKMLACEQLVYPPLKPDDTLPWLDNVLPMSDLMRLQALNLHKKGQHAAGLDEIINIIRASRMIADGYLIPGMWGTVATRIALERTLPLLLADTDIEADTLLEYVRYMEGYKLTNDTMLNIVKAEYAMVAWAIDSPEAFSFHRRDYNLWDLKKENTLLRFQPRNYFFQPIRTTNELIQWCDLMINGITALPDRQQLELADEVISPKGSQLLSYASQTRANAGGRRLLKMGLHDSYYYVHTVLFQPTCITQGQTLLALKAYHIRNGELPETLEALVPEYLPTIPFDEIGGQPIRYSRERKIIWSVANNEEDNSGDPEKDMVMEIRF